MLSLNNGGVVKAICKDSPQKISAFGLEMTELLVKKFCGEALV